MISIEYRITINFLFFALASTLLLTIGGGCVHPCLALAEELCECEETQNEKEACKSRAQFLFEQSPSAATNAAKSDCSELLDLCDCELIATEEGKRLCGLALDPDKE